MKTTDNRVKVIGAGLAGCEAAYQLSKRGVKVTLYECKPKIKSPAHHSDGFCELVCSNSLKSNDISTAGGLLKEELRRIGSLVVSCADACSVPAGGALAVDREMFSSLVTDKIKNDDNIEIKSELVEKIDVNEITVIATGPLTIGKLNDSLSEIIGESLHFYDAAAPIVSYESIDLSKTFTVDRYDRGTGDYINCPMNKEQYDKFVSELIAAECATLHDFEKGEIFESCMPVEVMAKRGADTLRFGPLRPVGFTDPTDGKRPYAVVQLRKENAVGTMYNIVGFQTNLKFGEQKRVFSLIPALENAEYLRYGVMHRNSFINAPKVLSQSFACKNYPNVYIAGQLSGVEGYVESIASGLTAGINAAKAVLNEGAVLFPRETVIGALSSHICTENKDFQPMNANFGILPPITERIKDKKAKKKAYSVRSLDALDRFIHENLT